MRRRLAAAVVSTLAVSALWPSGAGAQLPQPGDLAYVLITGTDLEIAALLLGPEDSGQPPGNTQLTDNDSMDFGPAYSRDGEWIAFTSDRSGNLDIFRMSSDGSNPMQVTTDPGADLFPGFYVGPHIGYMSEDPVGGDFEISRINVDGTNPVQLTNNAEDDLTPSVSPNGDMIAYAQANQGLYVMGADGSNDVQVPNTSAFARAPRWLNDNQLVYSEGFGMNTQIFLINRDGSGKTPLTSGSQDINPVPSPDGEYIAFQRNTSAGFRLFGMLSDGQNQGPFEGQDIAAEPDGMDWQARVAPRVTLGGLKLGPDEKLKGRTTASENAELFVGGVFSYAVEFDGGSRSVATASRKKKFKFKSTTLAVGADAETKFALKAPRRARKALEAAAEAGDKVKVTVTVTATDDLGDSSEVTEKDKVKPKK